MTEAEWNEGPSAQAIASFLGFMMSLMMFLVSGTVGKKFSEMLGGATKQRLADFLASNPVPPRPAMGDLNQLFNTQRDDALRNGLVIIGAWSAFEACFEDFCKGVLETNPGVLEDKDLQKLKVPLTQALAEDEARISMVYDSIEDSAGKGAGVGRFEDIIKVADRRESVGSNETN